MFGTSGVRGTVGEDVTAELALSVGRAVGSDADRVLVGRDVRDSGAMLADAASAGLRECGADVVRLGVVSTPTLARHVGWLDADAAVGVTASHNPAPDNGLKLWTRSGQAFDAAATDRIEARIDAGRYDLVGYDSLGAETTHDGASERTVAHLESRFTSLTDADVSAVIDLGNGTGRPTVDALVALGVEVTTLNAQADGRFPTRKSEPNADSLEGLCRTVAALDADLGIAHDGDSDRMMAVTESGTFVPGDVLLALFSRQALAEEGGKVAVPVDTSLLVSDVVREAGGEVSYTRVGDVHVAERASEAGYVFGGEPSGAWIWPAETLCPDAHFAALRLVELVAEAGPLSSLARDVPSYETRRENVRCEAKRAVMDRVSAALTETYDDVLTLDGVRIDTDDGWFLVRASGTEPLVRVTAEARDAESVARLHETARQAVDDAVDG